MFAKIPRMCSNINVMSSFDYKWIELDVYLNLFKLVSKVIIFANVVRAITLHAEFVRSNGNLTIPNYI